jgi:hypothetical protein
MQPLMVIPARVLHTGHFVAIGTTSTPAQS